MDKKTASAAIDVEKTIDDILSQMTVEEKIGQMQQLAANMDAAKLDEFRRAGNIGSFLHVLGKDVQKYVEPAEKSRLGIKPIFGIDAIHGHALLKGATVFPSQLAAACTFDESLVEKMGEVTAKEVAADGLDWVFSPVLCMGRDMRWGRVDETFGEDTEVVARLGAAIIKGYQKDGLVAACAKHYIAYGEATGGRDAYDSEVTERKVREVFLKPFKAASDAGCMSVMTAYGSIDGKPLTVNRKWLTDILKTELGFNGLVVTDWDNYRALVHGQRVCETMNEACKEGILAGNDMCMFTDEFYSAAIDAVNKGEIPISAIDDSVRRILRMKARLGLLNGMPERKLPPRSVIGCAEHAAVNYEIAKESAVLLKNNGVLPLGDVKRVAVIGPNADDVGAQYGDWTYYSHPNRNPAATPKDGVYTVLKGVEEVYGKANTVYAQGCVITDEDCGADGDKMIKAAVDAAKRADVAIVVIGDRLAYNGEGRDVTRPILRGRQIELLKRVKAVNDKVVAVLVNGKPLVLSEAEPYCDAIVETFNGGDMCGLAVARLIKGEENFGGRLPISFPCAVGSGPDYYDRYDYWHGGRYVDAPNNSPYPFGFGLSYTEFEISEPVLSKVKAKRGETVRLSVNVKNVGAVGGKETVQLYFRDRVCKMLTPVRKLLDFKKVFVGAGASAT
ncbi:MAG: glycoside hydrolase family 3 C-terminal domain-containing protein, partial [Clostridiales bacterium]|nr:glycoside hydrolase family 3 C-terminal domain-containing protein [Clostridiales bacterium]